jgi:hypothetical protein
MQDQLGIAVTTLRCVYDHVDARPVGRQHRATRLVGLGRQSLL